MSIFALVAAMSIGSQYDRIAAVLGPPATMRVIQYPDGRTIHECKWSINKRQAVYLQFPSETFLLVGKSKHPLPEPHRARTEQKRGRAVPLRLRR
jgi:hypothetical protein